jgi:probable H4MPT-linked C1 transfer pathway protein
LLFDIGSTTSDLIPLDNGRPVPRGRTDSERLRSHELVYSGVRRTPLCALLGGEVAAEWFATTRDVYLVLGQLPEDAADRNTADGRPATRSMARARMARVQCADVETTTPAEIQKLAERVLLRQVYLLDAALAQVVKWLPAPPKTVIVSGEGEFLAQLVLKQRATSPQCQFVSLGRQLGPEVSQAACAYAVAVLAAEEG